MDKQKYFYGNKISEYGMNHNRVDYAALAESFDAVLCNDITKLFYNDVCGEYTEPEQVNGFIDNSDEIEELEELIESKQEQIEALENTLENAYNENHEKYLEKQIEELEKQIEELEEQIEELDREQDEEPEIFQYYIISDSGYNILKYHTNEIVYHIDVLDIYVWGVTHFGTSWDYVLTNIKIEEE